MFFIVFLLFGTVYLSFGMIPINKENNPFFNASSSLTPIYILQNQCEISTVPSAPCGNCLWQDEIVNLLKSKELIAQDFKFSNSTNELQNLAQALDQKAIANKRAQLAEIFDEIMNSKFSNSVKKTIQTIYSNHLQKEILSVKAFVNECFLYVELEQQKAFVGDQNSVLRPGNVILESLFVNLGDAFSLIYSERKEIISVVALEFFTSYFYNINVIFPAFFFFKSFFAHLPSKSPWDTSSINNHALYRLIYVGFGFLYLGLMYRHSLPFFGRKLLYFYCLDDNAF